MDFTEDLEKIQASGRQLLSQVAEILDPETIEQQRHLDLEQYGADIRHGLRTPVTTVVGYAEMLMEDGEDRGLTDLVDDLRKIHTSARNMLEYVSDIINLTQIDKGSLRPSKDTDKVAQVMSTIQPLATAEFTLVAGGRILVVDDNATNRHLLLRRLVRQGHRVTEAENGRVALEKMRQDSDLDIVLLDIIMPEMNGYEALEQMKTDPALKHIPVIMLSSLDEIDSVVGCIELGAEEYLQRPINPIILQARIDACLEKKRLQDREREYLEQIRLEKEKSERLLLNILPGPIAERLKAKEGIIVDSFPEATVLFADIVGFTHLSTQISPQDAYLAGAGLVDRTVRHAQAVADFALDMLGAIDGINAETGRKLQLRVGINTGPVIAGVIGKSKFIYDLWGDTVNTASRMESHGEINRVHVTAATRDRLWHEYIFEARGIIPVKGKGEMETYFLEGKRP